MSSVLLQMQWRVEDCLAWRRIARPAVECEWAVEIMSFCFCSSGQEPKRMKYANVQVFLGWRWMLFQVVSPLQVSVDL